MQQSVEVVEGVDVGVVRLALRLLVHVEEPYLLFPLYDVELFVLFGFVPLHLRVHLPLLHRGKVSELGGFPPAFLARPALGLELQKSQKLRHPCPHVLRHWLHFRAPEAVLFHHRLVDIDEDQQQDVPQRRDDVHAGALLHAEQVDPRVAVRRLVLRGVLGQRRARSHADVERVPVRPRVQVPRHAEAGHREDELEQCQHNHRVRDDVPKEPPGLRVLAQQNEPEGEHRQDERRDRPHDGVVDDHEEHAEPLRRVREPVAEHLEKDRRPRRELGRPLELPPLAPPLPLVERLGDFPPAQVLQHAPLDLHPLLVVAARARRLPPALPLLRFLGDPLACASQHHPSQLLFGAQLVLLRLPPLQLLLLEHGRREPLVPRLELLLLVLLLRLDELRNPVGAERLEQPVEELEQVPLDYLGEARRELEVLLVQERLRDAAPRGVLGVWGHLELVRRLLPAAMQLLDLLGALVEVDLDVLPHLARPAGCLGEHRDPAVEGASAALVVLGDQLVEDVLEIGVRRLVVHEDEEHEHVVRDGRRNPLALEPDEPERVRDGARHRPEVVHDGDDGVEDDLHEDDEQVDHARDLPDFAPPVFEQTAPHEDDDRDHEVDERHPVQPRGARDEEQQQHRRGGAVSDDDERPVAGGARRPGKRPARQRRERLVEPDRLDGEAREREQHAEVHEHGEVVLRLAD